MPPQFTPKRSQAFRAADPHALRGSLYRYTFLWLDSGQSFWMYPVEVGRRSITGYRWTHLGWVYTGVNIRHIDWFFIIS